MIIVPLSIGAPIGPGVADPPNGSGGGPGGSAIETMTGARARKKIRRNVFIVFFIVFQVNWFEFLLMDFISG